MNSKRGLEGDGLCELFYNLLWTKETVYEDAFTCFLPDTVVFKNGNIIAWYFSDEKGNILRKKEANLEIENVRQVFYRKRSKYDVIALYLTETAEESAKYSGEMAIEYLTEDTFEKLLKDHRKLQRGILQRFIDPLGGKNALIQVIWTPNMCFFSRRVNKHLMNDTSVNVYKRVITFDGPDIWSDNAPVRGFDFPTKIRTLIENMIIHILKVSFDRFKVSKLVAFLKICEDRKVWFLWSSSVRLYKRQEEKDQDVEPEIKIDQNFKIPHVIEENLDRFRDLGREFGKMEKQLFKCPRCEVLTHVERLVSIEYRLLIQINSLGMNKEEHAEDPFTKTSSKIRFSAQSLKKQPEIAEEAQLRHKAADIPLIIRRLHPKLKLQEFIKYKNSIEFLSKRAPICFDCYYIVVGSSKCSGNMLRSAEKVEEHFKGTGFMHHDALVNQKDILKTMQKQMAGIAEKKPQRERIKKLRSEVFANNADFQKRQTMVPGRSSSTARMPSITNPPSRSASQGRLMKTSSAGFSDGRATARDYSTQVSFHPREGTSEEPIRKHRSVVSIGGRRTSLAPEISEMQDERSQRKGTDDLTWEEDISNTHVQWTKQALLKKLLINYQTQGNIFMENQASKARKDRGYQILREASDPKWKMIKKDIEQLVEPDTLKLPETKKVDLFSKLFEKKQLGNLDEVDPIDENDHFDDQKNEKKLGFAADGLGQQNNDDWDTEAVRILRSLGDVNQKEKKTLKKSSKKNIFDKVAVEKEEGKVLEYEIKPGIKEDGSQIRSFELGKFVTSESESVQKDKLNLTKENVAVQGE